MSDERPSSPGDPARPATAAPSPESSRQALEIDDIVAESQPTLLDSPPPVAPNAKGGRASERSRKERKSRSKLTMRIPDDEISRPRPPAPSAPDSVTELNIDVVAMTSSAPAGPSPAASADSTMPMPMPALGSNVALPDEDSWTPFQPTAVDKAEREGQDARDLERVRTTMISSPAVDIFVDEDDPPPAPEPEGGPDLRKTLLMDGAFDLPDASSSDPDAATFVETSTSEKAILGTGPVSSRGSVPDAEEIAPEDLLAIESKPGIRLASSPPPPPVPRTNRPAAVTPAPPAPVPPPIVLPPAPPSAPARAEAPTVSPTREATSTGPVAVTASPPRPAVVQNAPAPAAAPAPEASAIRNAPRPQDSPVTAARAVPTPSVLAPPPMSDAVVNRKRARPWWEELFNDDFIRASERVTDGQIAREVDFIEDSLAVVAGATVLDMACGTGRHAIDFVRRGYQVVGFDLSLAMLARAADEAEERGLTLNFVQGDMREMTFEETFDGIYCWNTSFGYFEEEKNAQVIAKVHRALKKGGQFLLDVVNRDWVMRQSPSLVWFEGDGCICMDEMQVDAITSRMRVKRTMMMDDGRTKEIDYSIRLYALHELGRLLHEHGFRVAEVSGRIATPGVFFGADSPRTLILAEKR